MQENQIEKNEHISNDYSTIFRYEPNNYIEFLTQDLKMLENYVCGTDWLGLVADDVKYNNPVDKLAHHNGKIMYPIF